MLIYTPMNSPHYVPFFPEVPTIFLAGPQYRDPQHDTETNPRWRDDALRLFEEAQFKGAIYSPEPFHSEGKESQIDWEKYYLARADCIMFWMARDLTSLPGFTSNIEWGRYAPTRRVVLGYPQHTPKMSYILHDVREYGLSATHDFKKCVQSAITMAEHNFKLRTPVTRDLKSE